MFHKNSAQPVINGHSFSIRDSSSYRDDQCFAEYLAPRVNNTHGCHLVTTATPNPAIAVCRVGLGAARFLGGRDRL